MSLQNKVQDKRRYPPQFFSFREYTEPKCLKSLLVHWPFWFCERFVIYSPSYMVETRANHCRFREEDGTCAILRQADSTPQKPICKYPETTTESCEIAINRRNPSSNPIDIGFLPPMGEID